MSEGTNEPEAIKGNAVDAVRLREAQRTEATADGKVGPEVSSPPGCLSITQGGSSQVGENGRAVASEDWFEFGSCVEWPATALARLVKTLEAVKERNQETRKDSGWVDLPGAEHLKVARTGKSKGGGRGVHFEFHLGYRGVEFFLANRQQYTDKMPNAWLCLSGRDCLFLGVHEGVRLFEEIVATLGGRVVSKKMSRVDLALDIAGVPLLDFSAPYANGQYISTARKDSLNRDGDELTGITRGKSPLRVVVYDKRREVLQGVDTNILDAMKQRRWGGELPSCATRIEFSVRRKWLHKQGVDSDKEYYAKRGAIVRALTEDFFRLTEERVDRENKHQSRAKTHQLWCDVQKAYSTWAGAADGELGRLVLPQAEPLKLIQQGIGCLRRAALLMGEELPNMDAVEWWVSKCPSLALRSELEQAAWLDAYRRESTEYPAFGKERAA